MDLETKQKFDNFSPEKRQALLNLMSRKNKLDWSITQFSIPIVPRKEGVNRFPVSFSQKRLWFIQQMKPDSFEYNTPMAFRLEGELNIGLLQETMDRIAQRHEMWRTIFEEEDGEPYQVVLPKTTIPIEIIDLSDKNEDDIEVEMLFMCRESCQEVFYLDKGPLARLRLYKKSNHEYVFLVVMHHIIIDAWSMNILKDEISKIYEGLCLGVNSQLPLPKIQYGDYATWQNEQLSTDVLEKQRTYWKEKLSGNIENLKIQTDYPRQSIRNSEGAHYHFQISSKLSEQIKKLAIQQNTTLFMLLMAAIQTLLYRYAGQDYITVGTPITNRSMQETESLMGIFVNNLVFNTYFGDNPTFAELLNHIKKDALNAYDNQDLPFEEIVKDLQPKRDLSRTPIYQVVFNLINTPNTDFRMYNLKTQDYVLGSCKATTDFTIYAIDKKDFISFDVEYSTNLFKESTMRRFGEQLSVLLESVCVGINIPVTQIEIMPEKQKEELIYKWNDNKLEIPDYKSIHSLFEAQVLKTPYDVAVAFEGKTLTFDELNRKSNQLAHYLIEHGTSKETRIGLFIDRSLEIVIAILAVLKAGATYVPLDPVYPKERIKAILQAGDIKNIITQRALLSDIPSIENLNITSINSNLDNFSSYQDTNLDIPMDPHQLMYILFTSGSTGEPKGVMVEHTNYIHFLYGLKKQLNVTEPVNFAIVSTFAADLGTPCVYLPLTTGGTVHIISYERATSPEKFADYFSIHNIDGLKLVPSHFEALQSISNPEEILPKKYLIFAGEICRWELIKKVQKLNPSCDIYNCYGPSETTVSSHCYKISKEIPKTNFQSVPLGRPLPNTHAYLLDKHMNPVPVGVNGELYLGGPTVARGYLGKKELTEERFLVSPFNNNERIYKTGDVCRLSEDGNTEFIGRADRQVKVRGYRVELGGIERTIRKSNSVEDAVVTIKKENMGDERLVAYITVKNNQEKIDIKTLRKFIGSELPDYMIPSMFVILDSFPITPNGKVDMKALPEPSLDLSYLNDSYVAPNTAMEKELVQIWSEILGIEKIGIDDDFFDLGGESFKAIKVTRKMGYKMSVLQLFQYPTIRELAAVLSGKSTQDDGGYLVKLTPNKNINPTLTLVCFPFAAANPVAYQPLGNELSEDYDLYAVRLPGHDYSKKEEALVSFEEMAQQCFKEIKDRIKGPIAVYGQCVGGALALRVAYLIEEANMDLVCLFEAANFPTPHFKGKFFDMCSKIFPRDMWVSDKVYLESLRIIGNADEVSNKEEEKFILKSIRHDARGAEQYFSNVCYRKNLKKLKAPICCVFGEQDRTTEFYEERYEEWANFSDNVSLKVVEYAGHFFQKHQPKELCGIIAEQELTCNQLKSNPKSQGDSSVASKKPKAKLSIFFIIIIGQIISILGSSLSGFSLGVWMYQKTDSITYFSMISICTLLPLILLNPIAGTVADRYDKRKVMIISDLLGMSGTVFVALMIFTNNVQAWHIYLAAAISSTGATFQRPAFLSAVPQIVPKRYLGQLNGIIQLGTSGGQMLGPVLGGVLLFAIGIKGVIILDVVSCLVCVFTLLIVRFPNLITRKREEPFMKELIGGWKYIITRPSLVSMVVFFVVANFFISFLTVLFTPLVLSYNNPGTAGMILALDSIGLLTGALVMSLWGGTKRRSIGMVGAVIITGISTIIIGLSPANVFIAAGFFLFGMSIAFIDTHWQILIQSKVGLELQGRVFSINQMVAASLRPIAFYLSAPLCEKVMQPFMDGDSSLAQFIGSIIGTGSNRGTALLFIIGGIVLIVWTILGLRYKPLYFMEDILPDAIPDSIILRDKDKLQELQLRTLKTSNKNKNT